MLKVRPSAAAAVSDLARAPAESSRPVVNFGQGELDFATPGHIKASAVEAPYCRQAQCRRRQARPFLDSRFQQGWRMHNLRLPEAALPDPYRAVHPDPTRGLPPAPEQPSEIDT